MKKKRYAVSYTSGATGYGWEDEANSLKEVRGMIKAVYSYTACIWVWDDVKKEHVYWKRVLTYKPEINTINAD